MIFLLCFSCFNLGKDPKFLSEILFSIEVFSCYVNRKYDILLFQKRDITRDKYNYISEFSFSKLGNSSNVCS